MLSDRTTVERLNHRIAALENERSSWIPHWKDLDSVLFPRQSRFFQNEPNRGNKVLAKIYDNTALLAVRTGSSGMMAGLT